LNDPHCSKKETGKPGSCLDGQTNVAFFLTFLCDRSNHRYTLLFQLEFFPWESQCGMWPWAVVEPETHEQQDRLIDNISQLVWQHLEILQEELGGCCF